MPEFDNLKLASHLSPVSLELYPHTFESEYPSFCCQMTCTIAHPRGRFVYEASNIWFGTEDFDRFHAELFGIVRGQQTQACLQDLSRDVVLTIIQRDRTTEIRLDIARPVPPVAETKLHFKADVELGFPASLLESMSTFRKWW